MTGEIPTKFGDVLILGTTAVGSLHQVCPVVVNGQQSGTSDRYSVSGKPEAVAKARTLVFPEKHIFFKDLDSGEWEEI